jgi:glycosyltransferase involved in cell wall biosynthesis
MSRRLILHDAFDFPGGGERVVLALARAFSAEVWTWRLNPAAFPPGWLDGVDVRLLPDQGPGLWGLASHSLAGWRAFAGFPRATVRWAVVSGGLALAAAQRIAGRKVLYCHTPPRMLYDLKRQTTTQTPALLRPGLALVAHRYRSLYENALRNLDAVVANSQNVRSRLQSHLGLDPEVIHPPCDTEAFRFISCEDFFLSAARLDPLKRVDRIVAAFAELPDQRLVVASDGPQMSRIRTAAHGLNNVKILGRVDETALRRLTGTCRATIYIPQDEDFGITPVESMAAGKPVIGVAEGGLLETVLPDSTGLLLSPNPSPADIAGAVRAMTAERAAGMREACEKQAARFSRAAFFAAMGRRLGEEPPGENDPESPHPPCANRGQTV